MNNKVAFKFAASTAMLGLAVVGCGPAGSRPAAVSANAAKADEGAAKLYAQAQAQVQQGNLAQALTLTERAVELAPRDAGYRMLLADLYLKNGRFLSADNAFSDVLTLDAGNSRAGLSRVLAMIAQGRTGEASMELDRLSATAAPADVGLAFALAGQPQRAIEMLEPAARAPDAKARVRQNLALAYALAGEWQKARTVAAQDLSPEDVAGRLQQWASFASPSAPHTHIAAFLNVTPAAADAGQPVRLALAPPAPVGRAYAEAEAPQFAPQPQTQIARGGPEEPAPTQELASAEPEQATPPPAPAPEVPVQVATVELPDETPLNVPGEAPIAFAPPSFDGVAFAAVVQEEPVVAQVAVPTESPKAKPELIAGAKFAAAVKALVEAPAPVVRASVKIASAPIRPFQPKLKLAQKSGPSRFVVQLGAFRSSGQVEKAWAQAQRRYGFAGRQPLSTTVAIPGKGTFHRLALSGFEAPADAARACQSIRAKGGVCFVRATAGDAPVQWASRYIARTRA